MATIKELNNRIDSLESKINEIGDLSTNLQKLQEFINDEPNLRSRAEAGLSSATQAVVKLTNATTDLENLVTRSTDIANRVSIAQVDLEKIETSTRELITQQQTAFSQAETERSTAFSTLLAEKNKELSQTVTDLEKDIKNQVTVINESIKEDLESIKLSKADVEKILGIVGEEGLTGEYSKNAIRDRDSANLWRRFTAASILIAVSATVWLAFAATKTTTNWHELLAKLILAISLSALAGYAGQQSAEHRKAQRHSEEMASQLVALKPYLGGITDQTKADEILSEVARKLFGQPLDKDMNEIDKKFDRGENPMIIGQLISLIQEFVSKK